MRTDVLVKNIRGWAIVSFKDENQPEFNSVHAEHMTCKRRTRPFDVCEHSWEVVDGVTRRYNDEDSRTKKCERCYVCWGIVPKGVVALVLFHNWEKI